MFFAWYEGEVRKFPTWCLGHKLNEFMGMSIAGISVCKRESSPGASVEQQETLHVCRDCFQLVAGQQSVGTYTVFLAHLAVTCRILGKEHL